MAVQNDSSEQNTSSGDYFTLSHDRTHEVYAAASFILAWVAFSFAVLGTITNGVSVILFTSPCMRSSMSVLLAGLSAFDLAFSILSIPTFVAPPMCVYNPGEWWILCRMTIFTTLYIYPLTNMAKTGSVWTLVYITVQRWITVRRPFRRARGSSLSFAYGSMYAILVASVLYNIPRYLEHQPSSDPQVLVEEALRLDPYYMSIYYSFLYLLTHFMIPFALLAFVNGRMACAIRKALKQRRILSHSEKAAAMMATIVLVFLSCNTLPFVMNFVEFINRDLWIDPETKISAWMLNDVSNILLLVNSSINAVIYYFCNEKYKQVLIRHLVTTYRYAKYRFNYPTVQPRWRRRHDRPSTRTPSVQMHEIRMCRTRLIQGGAESTRCESRLIASPRAGYQVETV